MLTRMKELTVQEANGTYNDEDKENINLEIDALVAEINNIFDTTEFNGMNVFADAIEVAISHDGAVTLEIEAATLDETKKLTRDSGATAIDTAIDEINLQRATYGAAQNRLEHTINNLGATHENLSAAESRIRDTDMAKEMTEFTKSNILQQAAQSMLAQANQAPQGVLSLLR